VTTPKKTSGQSLHDLVRQGDALRDAGDWFGAERQYRHATRLDGASAEPWRRLGSLMEDAHRVSEAAACLRHALEIERPEALSAVSDVLRQIASRPGWNAAQFNLGRVYWKLGEPDRARRHLEEALRLHPVVAGPVHALFAAMHFDSREWTEAIEEARRALEVDPRNFLALTAAARSYSALGCIPETIETLRRALAIEPTPDFHSSLLFDLNYLPDATPEAIYAEACRWNALYAAPLEPRICPHANVPEPERRLRLAYLSPDLYDHAVMKFLPPVFERHDRSRFEVFVYAVGPKVDPKAGCGVEHYVPLPASAEEIAERIRADRIDVLVDVAGHTMGRAFLSLALKPAPVQVSWLGSMFTSGMGAMDYFLGDGWTPAPGTDHLFTETVYRMPRACCCYRPFADVPVAPSPCLERDYITFGSFNNPRKIHREVVRLWAAILHLVPQSRLLLKYGGMERPAMQNRYRAWFAQDGIAGDRLRFDGESRADEYLKAYSEIDIALDPFPYCGGTTSMDTAWMGVPLVTLNGRLTVQRSTSGVLLAMGLADTIAETPEQYLRAALFLAETVPQVPGIRQNLRQALKSSPLMDESGLVRAIEDAYREMWRSWCRKQNGKE
jgi:predicted O-linked N-acetylglucosamine transferase (SPINDLY family)